MVRRMNNAAILYSTRVFGNSCNLVVLAMCLSTFVWDLELLDMQTWALSSSHYINKGIKFNMSLALG